MAVLTINEESFNKNVLESESPVVVKFGAPWCIHCRRLAPVAERVSDDHYDTIRFYDLNIDDFPKLAEKYGISTIPSLILFQGGNASIPFVNPPSQAAIDQWLRENGAA